nr:phospholipase A1-II 1-like [Ipomoea batatas]
MATLNAVDLAVNPINNNNNNKDVPITAFLYASPKVGDENFKKAFSNQQNLRALRISDLNDPIPKLPPFGWKEGETVESSKLYADVGVGLEIESKKSNYLKPAPAENPLYYHELMLYLHGIDLYQTPQGTIERKGVFDLAKVNKYQDSLIEDYRIPAEWFNIKDKGMVQLEDGNYILDDHEPDDNECVLYKIGAEATSRLWLAVDYSEKLNVEGSTVTLTPSGERISTVYDELASPTFVTVLVYVCDPDVDVVFTRFREKEGTNCKDVSRDAPFVFDFVVPEVSSVGGSDDC